MANVGRPADPNKAERVTIFLPPVVVTWLRLWGPAESTLSWLVNEVLSRAMRFWPKGPNFFGHVAKVRSRRIPSVAAYAAPRNLSRHDAIAELVALGLQNVQRPERSLSEGEAQGSNRQ